MMSSDVVVFESCVGDGVSGSVGVTGAWIIDGGFGVIVTGGRYWHPSAGPL